jgi:hypothetical protein
MRRIAVALVAVLIAGLTVGSTPAVARTHGPAVSRHTTAERQLPRRPIYITWDQVGSRPNQAKVAIYGKTVDYRFHFVYLQRRRNGLWHSVARDRTSATSRYRFVGWLGHGSYRFRVRVPRGQGYAVSVSRAVAFRVS